ncbi:hypothetical protein EV217_0976 [Phyllobacterium myrsinacearum]|nr:hypothetical protein EV217_0976 [Phyllobacterium myrsinacearum]
MVERPIFSMHRLAQCMLLHSQTQDHSIRNFANPAQTATNAGLKFEGSVHVRVAVMVRHGRSGECDPAFGILIASQLTV